VIIIFQNISHLVRLLFQSNLSNGIEVLSFRRLLSVSECILMTIFTVEINIEKIVAVSVIFRFSEFSIFDCSWFVILFRIGWGMSDFSLKIYHGIEFWRNEFGHQTLVWPLLFFFQDIFYKRTR
jgi:hypothetical protein